MNKKKSEPHFFTADFFHFTGTVLYAGFICILVFVLFIILSLFRISSFAFDTYNSYRDIPYHKVGLLLGTSSYSAPGQPNYYFTYRIMAATELFRSGKINYILVSGDNRHISYNEPREMRRALIKAGVPEENIIQDFAGISTLDSVVRAAEVFMLKDMTIISQDFQNERALFIASKYQIDASGFNAAKPDFGFGPFKVMIREFFARIKCIFDVYFLNSRPRFLGPPIRIGDTPMPIEPSNKPKHPSSKPKQPGHNSAQLKRQEQEAMARAEAAKAAAQAAVAAAATAAKAAAAEETGDTGTSTAVVPAGAPTAATPAPAAATNAAAAAEDAVPANSAGTSAKRATSTPSVSTVPAAAPSANGMTRTREAAGE